MNGFARLAGTTALLTVLAVRMSLTQGPAFEVAAIKENKSGSGSTAMQRGQGGRLTATNVTLVRLIQSAYGTVNTPGLLPFQVAAPPEAWMNTERFDITAKGADGSDPSAADAQLMLQALLRDRFKLVMRREARPTPVLVLKLARSDGRPGPQLKVSTLNCQSLEDKSKCGVRANAERMTAGSVRISQLATTLTTLLRDQIVLDQSNMEGLYDFELTYSGVPGRGAPPADAEHPPLPVAIEEQLGLKLSSERAPIDMWVIDSAQRPVVD